MLAASIVLITAALIAYTTGVWAEHRSSTLTWWHVIAFGVGLTCDASGTTMMAVTAATGVHTRVDRNPALAGIMATTGTLAILLMALHLAWAIVTWCAATMRRGNGSTGSASWSGPSGSSRT